VHHSHSHSAPRRFGTVARAVAITAAVATVAACTATPEEPTAQRGGVAVVALVGEPGLLNPFFSQEDAAAITSAFVIEPLFTLLGNGTYEADLAAEVPSFDNGGVSPDGLQVIYRIREGITWSDGEPFTTADLVFTIEAAQDSDGSAMAPPEYQSIVSTEVVDDYELVVQFEQPEPGFLGLFEHVQPAHAFESTAVALEDPLARIPLGTGPFVIEEFLSGDEIVLVANESYWKDPNLPLLDGVTVKITPDKQSALANFVNGDYDTLSFFTSGDFPVLEEAVADGAPLEISINRNTPGYVEYLWLNHSDNGDPVDRHPVIGDSAIREAIDLAIDRQSIVDDLLGGYATLTGSFLNSGFGSVDRETAPFDPDAARAALDAAGWQVGTDGVREKDGVRASLLFQTIAGDQDRVLHQQLIQQNLADVGIEATIENVDAGRIFGGLDEGGLLASGDFDILMSREGRYPDNAIWVRTFMSAGIPTEENGGSGFTYSHWRNAEFDAIADESMVTLDLEQRAALLAQLDEIFAAERVAIPVYATVLGLAWNDRLTGVESGFWEGIWNTAGTAHWAIAE